jgi:uncharacterized protein (DUF952 family)
MSDNIYKICSHEDWEQAKELGIFTGSEADKADGYIHFSPINLLESTVSKYFSQREGVVLEIDSSKIPNLVWEEARGGQLFPHLYESFKICLVANIYDLSTELNSLLSKNP